MCDHFYFDMNTQHAFIVLLLNSLTISIIASSITAESNPQEGCTANGTCEVKYPTCRYYLAPSSIPNSGFGVFTAEAIKKDEPLTDASDSSSVMVVDGDAHYSGTRVWSMDNYFWSGEGSGQFESASVEEYVVTFGTSCNYHTYLKNIFPIEAEYIDDITPRSGGSPGIGAYSYHGGALFYAKKDISAGEEIFAGMYVDVRFYGCFGLTKF